MMIHPPTDTAKPRTVPTLAYSRPDLSHAHAVRIPDAMAGADQAERLAELLARMEEGPAADFDIEARTERRVSDRTHRAVVRVRLNGWLWFLAPEDVRLIARCVRAEPEMIAAGPLPGLIAQALDRAARDAEALATARNAVELSGVA